MNKPIIINEELCIGCGMCAKDCVAGYIYVENGKARTRDKGCIACGHCYAICPRGAVTMSDYDGEGEEITEMSQIEPKLLLKGMKSRRTIRQFLDKDVEKEKIDMIIEAGRYSPTGGNAQDVSFALLGAKKGEIEAECVKLFRSFKGVAGSFEDSIRNTVIDDRFFFKGAPLVIVVSAKSSVNGALASSYMELMAESLGLGVLYSGFFQMCAKLSPKVKGMLKLPKGHSVVTCMVIGYPAVKYQRVVKRKDPDVRIID